MQVKAIFFHVPKTAGCSISQLKKEREDIAFLGHVNYDYAVKKFGKDVVSQAFKFSFVRNPYDRFVSAYHYLLQQDEDHKFWKYDKNISLELKKIDSFEEFCKVYKNKRSFYKYKHFLPMRHFLYKNNSCTVDFIGKYESIENDLKYICDKLNVDDFTLPTLNVSNHKNWREYYNSAYCADIVRDWYRDDFETFNYSREI